MKDFSPRNLVPGALLVVLVVAVTMLVDTGKVAFGDTLRLAALGQ